MHYTKILLVIFCLSLTSCKTIESRGQFVNDEEIIALKKKNLSQDEVMNLIGSPTYAPSHSPNVWIYIQRSMVRQAWFKPSISSQKLIKIEFDNNRKIKSVIVENNNHDAKLSVSNDYTQTHGTEQNGLQKFVKNLGRFNKSKTNKSRRKSK